MNPGRSLIPVIVVALVSGVAPRASAEEADHHKRNHHVIRISGMSVQPETLRIDKAEVVVFVNYSDDAVQIRFPASMASKFTCPVRPKFYRSGDDALLSEPIRGLEFALPCRLEPGSYEYTVLGTIEGGSGFDPDTPRPGDPKGKIIVK